MSIVKSFAVGNGDLCYIKHNSDNFSIVDCSLTGDRDEEILQELTEQADPARMRRFISTHPDQDHFGGIEKLDSEFGIWNFYVVKNQAIKDDDTASFEYYCQLRDSDKAFYIYKGCTRKWMNNGDETRASAGIDVLWPDTANKHFKAALASCDAGESYNNTSAVIRYSVKGGASIMWLGDLETEFMKKIADDIVLPKTTVVFASHHGRHSGKIPDAWLKKLDPQIIIIGEAPSRHLNYYTDYEKITQSKAGDITMELLDDKVHFYVSTDSYSHPALTNEGQATFPNYIGTITVETESTLE